MDIQQNVRRLIEADRKKENWNQFFQVESALYKLLKPFLELFGINPQKKNVVNIELQTILKLIAKQFIEETYKLTSNKLPKSKEQAIIDSKCEIKDVFENYQNKKMFFRKPSELEGPIVKHLEELQRNFKKEYENMRKRRS